MNMREKPAMVTKQVKVELDTKERSANQQGEERNEQTKLDKYRIA